MKAAVYLGPGRMQIEDYPLPEPEHGEVRLRVLLSGICMTDVHILRGHFPVQPPRVLGHELTGVVDAVGPGVGHTWMGRIVGVQPARFCGHCTMCQRGRPALCLNFACLGNTHDGGFAEYTVAQVDQLEPLVDLGPEQALWLEPLACVVHALAQLTVREGAKILVVGAGTLGKLMIQTVAATSNAPLAVVDPNPEKIDQALQQGAARGWVVARQGPTPEVDDQLAEWAPLGPEIVIDTSGKPAAIERAVDWVSPGGQLLLFGVFSTASRLRLDPNIVSAKELTIRASNGQAPTDFSTAHTLLRGGRLNPDALVWRTVELEAVPDILREMSGESKGKVVVRAS